MNNSGSQIVTLVLPGSEEILMLQDALSKANGLMDPHVKSMARFKLANHSMITLAEAEALLRS